jgi:hypothetical protein
MNFTLRSANVVARICFALNAFRAKRVASFVAAVELMDSFQIVIDVFCGKRRLMKKPRLETNGT